ncbi:MAG: hypothetical protein GWO02_11780, partial [Gammaproteobacteria bacterium]|nr:hypothetical protein [Gammaproteobacteria bacterium]
MSDGLIQHSRRTPTDIVPIPTGGLRKWLKGRGARLSRWVEATDFQARPGTLCLVPGGDGAVKTVLAGVSGEDDPFAIAQL